MTLWLQGELDVLDVLGEQSSRSLLDRAPRILLAEDDDDLRWALAGALAAEGFAIEQVTTSNELLERLDGGVVTEDCMPDIVISDIRMPGFNAVNVIRGLRDAGCRTPVVFMSAFDDAHIAERLQAIDLVTYLRKPLRVRDLVDAVAIMIGTVSPQPPPGAPGP